MKKHILLATAFATLLAVGTPNAIAQNVAIVNGKAVPKTRLETLAQQVAKSGQPVTPEMQSQLREEVIAREVFMQEAEKQGLANSDDFKTQMALARQTTMIRALFTDFEKKSTVTDADMKAEYDKFVASNGGKELKARHILVEKEDEAKAIIAALKKGGKFEDIAKKQSKDTGSGANGGDLDWANPSSYVPEFSAALSKLQKGQLTDTPVKTQFGYHVIRLDDTRIAKLPAFEEVKPQIAKKIQNERMSALQQGLRDKAKVEPSEPNVASINGQIVPKSRLEALAQQVVKSGQQVTPEIQTQLREEVIAREIFMQEAEKQNMGAGDDYKTQMELMRQTIMIRALFAEFAKKSAVTDAEMKVEYDKFVAANGGKEFKARHILVEKEDEAKAIIAALKKGGKFEDIAKKQSKDSGSGAKGGDLDWANPGSYVPEFSAALVKLQKGQLTDTPVKTQFGYHVIRLDDIRDAKLPTFDEVKPQIAKKMDGDRLALFQQGLREKAKVE